MLTKENKEQIIKEFGRSESDSGSSEVQIALLTARIKDISQHLKSFPKDNHSRRGLIKLVGRRRTYVRYLKQHAFDRYEFVMDKLNLKRIT